MGGIGYSNAIDGNGKGYTDVIYEDSYLMPVINLLLLLIDRPCSCLLLVWPLANNFEELLTMLRMTMANIMDRFISLISPLIVLFTTSAEQIRGIAARVVSDCPPAERQPTSSLRYT